MGVPTLMVGLVLATAQAGPARPADPSAAGVRHVSASAQAVIPLQTRVRFTTMIVLPEGEEILDVVCGDKEFWIISATHNMAHVKPAKDGAATNLNLVTASGAVYSFLLTERGGAATPDLKVYVDADPNAAPSTPKFYSAAEMERVKAEVAEAHLAIEAAERHATETVNAQRQEYPTKLQFVYGTQKYMKPFLVRAIWHDGQFTYIKTDAQELPALYELKDGKAAVVNFQVRGGTYVVPKVIDRGYLALGDQRLPFSQQGQ